MTPTAKWEAMRRVERVLNDRRGFHVYDLDEETRDDLLAAIVDAVLINPGTAKEALS